MSNINNSKRGYTMIELVVIITLIGILAAIYMPNLIDTLNDAHKAHINTVKEMLNTAILLDTVHRFDNTGEWVTPLQTDITFDNLMLIIDTTDWYDNGAGMWTYKHTGASITYKKIGQEKYSLLIDY